MKQQGSLRVAVHNKRGEEMIPMCKMTDVGYDPSHNFNLFSAGKRLKDGWKIGGDDKMIWLQKGMPMRT